MDSEAIVQNLYAEFQSPRPTNFTDYEHCDECEEHNQTMKSVRLEDLTAKHLGTAGWSPLSFLTQEAFEYCMPRFLELMMQESRNLYDEPIATNLLFHLAPNEDRDRFINYSRSQSKAVLNALRYSKARHQTTIVDYYIQEDLDKAIQYWNGKTNGN